MYQRHSRRIDWAGRGRAYEEGRGYLDKPMLAEEEEGQRRAEVAKQDLGENCERLEARGGLTLKPRTRIPRARPSAIAAIFTAILR